MAEHEEDHDGGGEEMRNPAAKSSVQVLTVPFWQLFKYADGLDLLLMAVGTFGAIAHGMVLPINMHMFGRIVNSLGTNQHNPKLAASAASSFALILFILALNSAWVTWLEVACWMHTGERQAAKIRSKYLESLLHQEIAFFDSGVGTGQVVSRIGEDTLLVHQAIGEKVGSLIHNLTTFVGGFVVGLVNTPRLALLTMAVVPMLAFSGAFFNRWYTRLAAETQGKFSVASSVVEQTIAQVRIVYSFVGETKAVAQFSTALDAATTPRLKSGLVKGLGIGASLFFLNSSWAVQLLYGAKLVAQHKTDGGNILATVFCVVFGGMALGQATPTMEIISRGRVAACNIFRVIDRRSEIDARDSTGDILSPMQGRIELDNVSFAYPSRPEAPIFDGLSLVIPEAHSIALVGGSGSGKSTVISLIQRFYDVSSGEIRIDGKDIKSLQLSWLRSSMGLVAQEPALFATTIGANICFGASDDVSQTQIEEAAKAANAHHFISKLPQGYSTLVGERGVQLSGGQKQRIAIARAVIRAPKFLLLDEATSALDAASEHLVQEALDKLMLGRTTVVVAHRLSTIRHAHQIAVFEQGRVAEMGTHEELVSKPGGVYSQLVQMQQLETSAGDEDGAFDAQECSETWNPVAASPKHVHAEVVPRIADPAPVPASTGTIWSTLRKWCVPLTAIASGKGPTSKGTESGEERLNSSSLNSSSTGTDGQTVSRSMWRELCGPDGLVGNEWMSVALGSICAIISGSLNPLSAFFLIQVVSMYYSPVATSVIYTWCSSFFVLAAVAIFCSGAQHYLFVRTGNHISKRIRKRAFAAVMTSEVGWFDREENGSSAITGRLSSKATLVDLAVSDSTSLVVQYIASAVIALTMGFVFQWRMALITILTFPFSMAGGSMKQGFMTKGFSGDLAEMHDRAMSLAGEAVSNIRTVASFGAQGKVVELFDQNLMSPLKESMIRAQLGGVVFGLSQAALHSANAMGLWYASRLVGNGQARYSAALQTFQILAWTGYVLAEALSLFPDIKSGIQSAGFLFSMMHRRPQMDTDVGKLDGTVEGRILFDKVHFSYPSRPEVTVLEDVSLSIEPGTTTALVGASGSGKSSIFCLLQRFYEPAAGRIAIDGVDIRTVHVKLLRQTMGLVQQEPALFGSMSIGDNIKYGNDRATEAEMVGAATLADAHTFICGLPDGYDTQVGDRGVQLSGGQKQRIAIARALLKDAPILLLDEATSALDAAAESAVLGALQQQQPRKTMVIIAHRLSTIQNADSIVAMNNGRVVERGTHATLLQDAKSLYSMLVRMSGKTSAHARHLTTSE